MNFNQRSNLNGKHAFLSPSTYHWINYTDQKLAARYASWKSAQRGTDLHDLAHAAIKLGVKIASSDKTLSLYVRDGIGYKMTVEQPLYYSDNCFGSADTIAFRRSMLRIHDLKTGIAKASPEQLKVYAALFCLEYNKSPLDIGIELRIYQSGEVHPCFPTPEEILRIMDTIVYFDHQIELLKEEDQ